MFDRMADAHSCVPLHPKTNLDLLKRHLDSGFCYVSINVGMDMTPVPDIMRILASFIRQLKNHPFLIAADKFEHIQYAEHNHKLAVSFDLEGSIPLLEHVDMIALYRKLGVRQIHLAYNRNNSAAGGAHDDDCGLSAFGRRCVETIHQNHILMDVSHSGYKTSMDVFSCSEGHPVLYSHANPYGLVPHPRNIKDEQIRACAATGGVIGINGVARFLGDHEMKSQTIAQHIDYVCQMVGSEYVAIGLDYLYDNGLDDCSGRLNPRYWWPPSAGYDPEKGLTGRYAPPEIAQSVASDLRDMGYRVEDINRIMGKNIKNLIKKVWAD